MDRIGRRLTPTPALPHRGGGRRDTNATCYRALLWGGLRSGVVGRSPDRPTMLGRGQPAGFVFSPPELHGLVIVQDVPIGWITVQRTSGAMGDIA